MAVVYLIPDGEGTVQQWTPFPTPGHYDKVDDPVGVPDENATYVDTNTLNDIEDFNHQTSALLIGATITNVRLTFRALRSDVGIPASASVNPGVRIIGTRYPAPVNLVMTTVYADYTWNWANNPAPPGNPWTKADIDNLESSIMLSQIQNSSARCTQLYFTVTYTPGITPVAGSGLVSWTP